MKRIKKYKQGHFAKRESNNPFCYKKTLTVSPREKLNSSHTILQVKKLWLLNRQFSFQGQCYQETTKGDP
jgi:hypothetical protein